MSDIRIFSETDMRLPRARVLALADAVTHGEDTGAEHGTINIVFTSDRTMRELNRRYRNRARTTDVLSFKLDDDAAEGDVVGEVYVSAAAARRQALLYRVGLYEEILRLVCHGLLHLAGYDHDHETDAVRMRRREEHYLKQASKRR